MDYAVQKWSDISHAKCALGNRLYGIKSAHRQQSKKVIKYVQRSFIYAVAQNKGDSASLKMALNAIVPHMYGEHDICRAWCRFAKENPSVYRHKDLPHHKDLMDPDMKDRSPSKRSCMIFLPTQTSWLPTSVSRGMNRSI